jgi:hypothetical protein
MSCQEFLTFPRLTGKETEPSGRCLCDLRAPSASSVSKSPASHTDGARSKGTARMNARISQATNSAEMV